MHTTHSWVCSYVIKAKTDLISVLEDEMRTHLESERERPASRICKLLLSISQSGHEHKQCCQQPAPQPKHKTLSASPLMSRSWSFSSCHDHEPLAFSSEQVRIQPHDSTMMRPQWCTCKKVCNVDSSTLFHFKMIDVFVGTVSGFILRTEAVLEIDYVTVESSQKDLSQNCHWQIDAHDGWLNFLFVSRDVSILFTKS